MSEVGSRRALLTRHRQRPVRKRSARFAERRGQLSWALFDWADAPFTTLIITFLFPAYFTTGIVRSDVLGQAVWGYTIAASGLIVALLAPSLGAIADAGGRRKPWIFAFALLCMLGSGLLWFARPESSALGWAIACVITANLGYEGAVMFPSAMLPDVVSKAHIGRFSGWAWGLGYIGGLVALALALFLFISPEVPAFGLNRGQAEDVRAVGPLVATWLGLFGLPLFLFTPDRRPSGLSPALAIKKGLGTLRVTLLELPKRRDVARFLVAHMIYADALATLFAFGGVYAVGTFGMSLAEVIRFGVMLNIAAGLGAFAFGWVDDWIGSRRTVAFALLGLIVAGTAAVLAPSRVWLWAAGCALGLFVGPAQASSRSLMARLCPPDRQTEFFGLFALSRKATNFIGPMTVASVTNATGSQRIGIAILIGFFALGLMLLLRVSETSGTGRGHVAMASSPTVIPLDPCQGTPP